MLTIKTIGKGPAEKCLASVKALFADRIEELGTEPVLYGPGFHADSWTIAWEGVYEWTLFTLVDPEPTGWPKGVYAEPVNGWCLGLIAEDFQ